MTQSINHMSSYISISLSLQNLFEKEILEILLTVTTISIEESNFEMRIGSASLFFIENITKIKIDFLN